MLFKRQRLFSLLVTPHFRNPQNRNKTPLKNETKFQWNICFFGKVINPLVLKAKTRETVDQKMMFIKNEKIRTIKRKHDH